MKVPTKTRYALRLMLQLAFEYGKKPPMLGDIAKKEDLSEKYLSLIVLPLRAHGLINSVRGAKGGYYLAKEPSQITVLDIFEATDGKICSVDCLRQKNRCERLSECICRDVWRTLDNSIEKTLSSITLAELVENYSKKNNLEANYEI